MQDTVRERQAEQGVNGGSVCLGSTDHAAEIAIIGRLLRQHPAEHPALVGTCEMRGTSDAERALRTGDVRADAERKNRNCQRWQR